MTRSGMISLFLSAAGHTEKAVDLVQNFRFLEDGGELGDEAFELLVSPFLYVVRFVYFQLS